MVGDRELYNTATELTRIMGHRNPDRFFCDPTAINPQTGQLLHPPPAPPSPPPDPKLLVVDGWFAAYEGDKKVSSPTLSIRGQSRCSEDGLQALYVDRDQGQVKKVNIEGGNSEVVATFKPGESAVLSFSPDLRTIAADQTVQLTQPTEGLRVLLFDGSVKRGPNRVIWNADASRRLVTYFGSVEILDAHGVKIGSGSLSKDSYVRRGWFDMGEQTVTLFLSGDDEQGPGILARCRIAAWSCQRLRPRVDSVSVSDRGILATVSPLGKLPKPSEGGTIVYSDKYAAEIRDRDSRLLARQIFRTSTGRTDFEISLSPTGRSVALRWIDDRATCRKHEAGDSFCQRGILVDLTKVIK